MVILSWPIDDDRLAPLLSGGLTLDHWGGDAYVSLVCLFVENLRVLGVPAFPRKFEEVNLRFYVRPEHGPDDRKGVAFLRQLVPHRHTALAGRYLFREPMSATALSHEFDPAQLDVGHGLQRLGYTWRDCGREESLRITAAGEPYFPVQGSLQEFLTARYWGYNCTSGGRVRAYRISRGPWSLIPVIEHELKWHAEIVGRPEISDVMAGPPASVLLAFGSESRVHWPAKLRQCASRC